MQLLALETVTRSGSIALWDGGACRARKGDATRMHGARLPGELVEWLSLHGRRLSDIDVFAVVTGPGSFTGLRVGLAAVQGLALATGRPVVGIPTLDALATTWTAGTPGPHGLVAACLDGQRGDVFIAAFETRGETLMNDAHQILAPIAARPDEAADRLANLAGLEPVVIVREGDPHFALAFQTRLPTSRIVEGPMVLAEAAARLAVDPSATATQPHALRPLYIRRPDAELVRERARRDQAGDIAAVATTRRATGAADLAAVEALQGRTFTNPWSAESIRWELENTDVARLYVMHESGGSLIAYCACWMVFDELHINSLAVDPAWRRRGIARRLLRDVFGEARRAGARAATLEVRSSNQAARSLYEGLGFKVEGIRRDYYQEPREDALILWNRALT